MDKKRQSLTKAGEEEMKLKVLLMFFAVLLLLGFFIFSRQPEQVCEPIYAEGVVEEVEFYSGSELKFKDIRQDDGSYLRCYDGTLQG